MKKFDDRMDDVISPDTSDIKVVFPFRHMNTLNPITAEEIWEAFDDPKVQ
jgi:hypothetical protein